jgi:hypothetical protein
MPPPEPVTLPAPDPASPATDQAQPSAGRSRTTGRLLQGTPVRDRIGIAVCSLVGLVHVAVVAPTYHVGSFDDDASYVMTARALAHLHGLTSTLPVGLPLISTYPIGYPTLLAPLAAIGGHATLPMRVLSAVLFLMVFPLTWAYLRGRGFGRRFTYVVLALLALNPVLATYGSMVMAEVPFVVAFLLTLLALERWADQSRTWTVAGGCVIVLLPALVWIKEAGIGIAAGAMLYLLWRKAFRKALAAAVGFVALLLPLLIARVVSSSPVLGSRYSSEIGGGAVVSGGLWHRLTTIPGQAISLYWHWAVPDTIVPTSFDPFSSAGWLHGTLTVVRLSVAPIVLLGIVGWIVRLGRGRAGYLDAAVCTVGVYFLETLLYPFTNERRVILVLPVVLAWAVLGVQTLGQLLSTGAQVLRTRAATRPVRAGVGVTGVAGLVAVAVAIPLIWQFPRNYMLPMGHSTSRPASSPSMALLRQLGQPSEVVETDYVWATALYSGHRARNGFFLTCSDAQALAAARTDHAKYILTSGFANIGIGSPCGLEIASRTPSAVRLYRTTRDSTAVFELVGPGTLQPDETDLTSGRPPDASTPVTQLPEPQQLDEDAGSYPTTPVTAGSATMTWNFARPALVQQVSVGAARADSTSAVDIEIRTLDGHWIRVAHADGAVGEGQRTPYLLTVLKQPVTATAMRVRISGTGTAQVHDTHALGTGS